MRMSKKPKKMRVEDRVFGVPVHDLARRFGLHGAKKSKSSLSNPKAKAVRALNEGRAKASGFKGEVSGLPAHIVKDPRRGGKKHP
jgi:hypothetical protein